MRWKGTLLSIAMAALVLLATPLAAATFGTVVPLGGNAADLALDEARGLLYIANFTANRIDVLTLADNVVHSSMNVGAQPGSLALSPDGRYLLVTNYASWTGTPPVGANQFTLIDLVTKNRQSFTTGDAPLAAAFVNTNSPASGVALIATVSAFYIFDPITGQLQHLASYDSVPEKLPVPAATFPSKVLKAAMAPSGDLKHIWGVLDAGTQAQLIFVFDAQGLSINGEVWETSPTLLPRVSVAQDGSWALIGWSVYARAQCGNGFMIKSRHGTQEEEVNTGHAVDSKQGVIYAHFPDPGQPSGPPYTSIPTLSVLDADNLALRDRIYLPENMTGRALMSSTGSTMYAVSASGVMVLPVGNLSKARRLATTSEDLLIQSNFCNRNAMKQTFTLSDSSGAQTDFYISANQPGVTISPNSGTTPAVITVTVDPGAVQNTFGTLAVPLTITSSRAVNVPPAMRLLISNPDQDQRGTIINVPGVLTDVLADQARKRYYIVRQDKNQVLVFDATNNQQIGAMRTGNTPTRMSFSNDNKYLMVAAADSQLIQVFDLDTMSATRPIQLPASHYGRAVGQSNNGTFAVVKNDSGLKKKEGNVDKIDMVTRCAVEPPSLGIWENDVTPTSVLTPTPNQSAILMAEGDGNVKLYDATAGTWVLSRADFKSLDGAYAAADIPGPAASNVGDPTNLGVFVVGNYVLNPALVPIGTLDASVGKTLGFAFTGLDQAGFRFTGGSASGPGVIQNLPGLPAPTAVRPVRVTEAPVVTTLDLPFTRTVAPMPNVGNIVTLTTSGVTLLSKNYDVAVPPPSIAAIVNAADGGKSVAPGGLVSIYGANLAPNNAATSQVPLPSALAQSCIAVNGMLMPLLFVSSGQVNAQLPSKLSGSATMSIHTVGGVSDNFNFNIVSAAPSVFTTGTTGPLAGMATMYRADNYQLVTPSNPLHIDDTVIIYLTGMGATSPAVEDGMAAPESPLAEATFRPEVTLGGYPLEVSYAGLVPGYVGLYQINAKVVFGTPQGFQVPLMIRQGSNSTTLPVRVVK